MEIIGCTDARELRKVPHHRFVDTLAAMPVSFDHVAIPSADCERSARFLGEILGVPVEVDGPEGEFFCLRLSGGAQVLFQPAEHPTSHHVAFRVGDAELQALVERLRAMRLPFGNDPESPTNMKTDDPLGGRGRVYFTDPDGHFFEVCA
jgi:catechol 2,3-dioxygenase-like lactoylglutathione lyase family enzyme